jgi:hypothetical protein
MSNRRGLIAARCLALSLLVAFSSMTPAGEPFHGNARTRVFHQPSCRHYSCPNCTVRFDTVPEAVEAGFRPCGVCDPAGSRKQISKTLAPYAGNIKSRKFHRGSCRYATCANCAAKFKTREEAIKAGYAPGGCCDP